MVVVHYLEGKAGDKPWLHRKMQVLEIRYKVITMSSFPIHDSSLKLKLSGPTPGNTNTQNSK